MMTELIIDSFAGGGGASTGIEMALGRSPDIAINHDDKALAMHAANHPQTRHICKSVWDVDPRDLASGQPVGLLWASPDCTHFSKARGGKPADHNIRDLAWVVTDYAEKIKPRVIILENVEEFRTWGPLQSDNRPDPTRRGETFALWLAKLKHLGYHYEWRELRACDYGAPTIRKRFFLIARSDGLSIVWPEPTHAAPKSGSSLPPWRTAAEIIDWTIPCPSIFERKRPLADNTLKRIYRGLQKFVIDDPNPFILTYYGSKGEAEFRGCGMDDPLPTQTTENRHALVTASIHRMFGKGTGQRCDVPTATLTSENKTAILSAHLAKHYGGVIGISASVPLGTITSIDHHSLVASYLTKFRGTCNHGQRSGEPAPTITGGGTHIAEVRAFLIKYYAACQHGASVTEPMHTLTAKARLGLVTVHGEPYQITDIGLRMLTPRELFRAQGFPDSYIIDKGPGGIIGWSLSKADQVRMCGNSVCPQVAAALVSANCAEMAVTNHSSEYRVAQ